MSDSVNHPSHYTSHPSGVECIQVTEHLSFNKGSAIKCIWRSGEQGNDIEDLQKARWYIEREIQRLTQKEVADKLEKAMSPIAQDAKDEMVKDIRKHVRKHVKEFSESIVKRVKQNYSPMHGEKVFQPTKQKP